ncbi:hypothetical protein [Escherichia coli]|uniref:hypothetical protein n=1 Tax=Escherichia coli TaxID=562 RepID=UPI0012FF8B3E|nr:hypothetical protein [Escherichia coli]
MKTIFAALILGLCIIVAAEILAPAPAQEDEKIQTGMEQTCMKTDGNKISYYACH